MFLERTSLDLPDVVGDQLGIVELVVPVCSAAVQLVVVVVFAEALEKKIRS